jgi:DnaK suppressor protein
MKTGSRASELREMLERRRAELRNEVKGRIRETRSATDREKANDHESAESDIQEDIDLSLIQLKSDMLRRIDAALSRLDQGTYGHCVDCQEPISKQRLRALPFAARCTGCEQARETTERPRSSLTPRRAYDPLALDA